MHEELFTGASGAIGAVSPVPFGSVKDDLMQKTMEERVRMLVNGRPKVGWLWEYLYVDGNGDSVKHESNTDCTAPIIFVGVLEGLEQTGEQRQKAAELTHAHFLRKVQNPAVITEPTATVGPGETEDAEGTGSAGRR